VSHFESSENDKERETLERYCNRQVKSRKFIKRKIEDLEEKIQWKRQKEQEKDALRKKVVRDQYYSEMQKRQKDVKEYQERWH
jgi:hypothetical protein